jgi:hypothetical protein
MSEKQILKIFGGHKTNHVLSNKINAKRHFQTLVSKNRFTMDSALNKNSNYNLTLIKHQMQLNERKKLEETKLRNDKWKRFK